MKSIRLSNGMFSLVDEEDIEVLSRWKWQAKWNTCTRSFYAIRELPTHKGWKRKYVRMHRQILGLEEGNPLTGDHINHDTLDNRRANLRVATKQEQQYNIRISQVNKTGFKGVSVDKGRFRARIRIDKKEFLLGYYSSPEEAHIVYCKAAKQHHGKFARTQ